LLFPSAFLKIARGSVEKKKGKNRSTVKKQSVSLAFNLRFKKT
jgi:hypothetical protein